MILDSAFQGKVLGQLRSPARYWFSHYNLRKNALIGLVYQMILFWSRSACSFLELHGSTFQESRDAGQEEVGVGRSSKMPTVPRHTRLHSDGI